ncbi:hypothetical protein NDU88_009755 [Pleurodeles waltl]|uniref:Uncharacterized protein n=1 Tax=Pleurodeles waltl TaxID=8319 RepID=A0AAV7S1B7_PLEWA|nr:hypothetical protein NDU88_009755 [Pleurodeles waltl]
MRAVHGNIKEDPERSGERREADKKDTRGTTDVTKETEASRRPTADPTGCPKSQRRGGHPAQTPATIELLRPAAMPKGKSSSKHSSQLLFSEAIAQLKPMAAHTAPPSSASSPADPHVLEAEDRILLEIAAVGRRLEVMDSKISDKTVASSSIRADIAGFQETLYDLDLTNMEGQVAALPDHEAELRFL